MVDGRRRDLLARAELDRILRVRFVHPVRWAATVTVVAALSMGGVGLGPTAGILGGATASASTVSGAQLPAEVSRIDRQRYLSKRSWDRTIKFYQGVYGRKRGIIWKRIDTPPGIKAIHIANTRARRRWDGINIYEAEGKVTIFVLPALRGGRK